MREIMLVALVASGCLNPCPERPESYASENLLVGTGDALTASWFHVGLDFTPILTPCDEETTVTTGSLGQQSSAVAIRGVRDVVFGGAHSSVWLDLPGCAPERPGTWARLVANGSATSLQLSTDLAWMQPSVVFDGTEYHAFWASGSALHHRTIGEDGALGPDQVMPSRALPGIFSTISLVAARDDAGGWFVALSGGGPDQTTSVCWAMRVDLTAQTTTTVWSATEPMRMIDAMVWFDGAFRIFGRMPSPELVLTSITPAGDVEEHERFGSLTRVVAGRDAIYGSGRQIAKLDPTLTHVVTSGIPAGVGGRFAVVGDAIAVFEQPVDFGDLAVVAYSTLGVETSRTTLEASGPLFTPESCPRSD